MEALQILPRGFTMQTLELAPHIVAPQASLQERNRRLIETTYPPCAAVH